MPHHRLKFTSSNIINLWFGADTPIRRYKTQANPELWAACQRVHLDFRPPSGAQSVEQYRKSDLAAFARAVQQELNQAEAGSKIQRITNPLRQRQ